MRYSVKIFLILVLIVGGYFGYKHYDKIKQELTPLDKGKALYTAGKYDKALTEFKAALKDPKTAASPKDHAQAMRRIGDCYFKMWDWRTDPTAGAKSKAAYDAYKRKYPKDYKENGGYIVKNLERMGLADRKR